MGVFQWSLMTDYRVLPLRDVIDRNSIVHLNRFDVINTFPTIGYGGMPILAERATWTRNEVAIGFLDANFTGWSLTLIDLSPAVGKLFEVIDLAGKWAFEAKPKHFGILNP
jgi:hypothetical protein